jgi:2-polyprenyl-3-methyl-5-hydroxy-6-metoxy-1,4-benzoquinol methylase
MNDNRNGGRAAEAPLCPVCLSTDNRFFALGRDRLFGLAAGRFRLYRCTACDCIFQSPLPAPDAVASWYPARYWWAEDAHKGLSGFQSRMERVYREFVARDHVRFLERCAGGDGPGRSLLDIGCGSGTFLHLAGRRGFAPHGMDASAGAVEGAKRRYGFPVRQGIVGSDVWEGRHFDIVTMFHVLEHLVDPKRALEYARGLLKPGGRLLLQVPNAASIQARCFGAHWYGLDVPRHLINFTPRSLARVVGDAGFSCHMTTRFSLRDNPAALASSVAISLDPIGRRGRQREAGGTLDAILEFCYFGLVLLALPAAWIESFVGRGATLWVHARK